MISIIAGTNRPGSSTLKVAREIEGIYRHMGLAAQVIDLALLPREALLPAAYAKKPAAFAPFAEAVLNSSGLVLVAPEYNGSFPGVLKYFIDLLKFPESFQGRPAAFVGLAAGQWGALRAVEHLQQVFSYREAHIYPNRVFIPGVSGLFTEAETLRDENIAGRLKQQAAGFATFIRQVAQTNLAAPRKEARGFVKSLGVCTWSLQPETPAELIRKLKRTGISRVQLALDPLREKPEVWGKIPELFAKAGITMVSGMFGCVGEDYTTLETIKRTGGVVPDATWEQNWANIRQTVDLAARLKLKLVAFHAGFLPHDQEDPDFKKLVGRLRQIAGAFAAKGIDVAFETGQESASTLREFLEHLDCPNVGVNFDPANMILYDQGNPVFALRILAPWVKQFHLKEANRTLKPGTWGEEVPLGTGQVNWRAFFQTIREIGFKGNLCIEREAGTRRVEDIRTARQYVENLQ